MSNPIVCYLFTTFDKIDSIKNFKVNYLRFNAGINHELFICFKLLTSSQISKLLLELKNLEFKIYEDPSIKNDYDFGSYKRFSENHIDSLLASCYVKLDYTDQEFKTSWDYYTTDGSEELLLIYDKVLQELQLLEEKSKN